MVGNASAAAISSAPRPFSATKSVGWRTAYATFIFFEMGRGAWVKFVTSILKGSPLRTSCVPFATRRPVLGNNEFFGSMWITPSTPVTTRT